MILEDFHVHTCFCDGKDEPEQMVLAAIKLNMKKIGLLHHSYVPFDEEFCIKKGGEREFIAEIDRLRQKYCGKIEIYCGIEQDYFSKPPADNYDYVIGSVHYVKINGKYFSVDESVETFEKIANDVFGGDYYAFAEEYFRLVSNVLEKTNADIIGHFDLISKFNESGRFFDEKNKRYINAANFAIEKLVKYKIPFEVNMGAAARGYKTEFYPNEYFIRKIAGFGGKFILSSDAHSKDFLCFEFEKSEEKLKSLGADLQKFRQN